MKNLYFLFTFLLLAAPGTPVEAQNITRNAGFRGGQTSGFTLRNYFDESNAIEGILSFRKQGLQVTGLKQFIIPKFHEYSENIFMVWGYGAHAGTTYSNSWDFAASSYYGPKRFSPVVGIDGYISLEYRIREFPLVVGIDYKPFFELSATRYFSMSLWDLGFCLSYAF